MIVISKEQKANLIDTFKSALACSALDLGFGIPAEEDETPTVVDPAGVIAGLAMAFGIIGLEVPQLSATDLAEFKEINGIQ